MASLVAVQLRRHGVRFREAPYRVEELKTDTRVLAGITILLL